MSHWTEVLTDVSRSVRDRLSNIASETGENFQVVLVRYGTERLIYRISRSDHRDRFVLKGAWLFYLREIPRRTTRDVDFLSYGHNTIEAVKGLFREIVQIQPDVDDGLRFDPESVEAEQTQEEGVYRGVRVKMTAQLGQARIPIRVDFDLYVLMRERSFEAAKLRRKIEATFARRDTDLPTDVPDSLGRDFGESEASQRQWEAFLRRTEAEGAPRDFAATLRALRAFLAPVLEAVVAGEAMTGRWRPEEGWG